ncbi:hypothetical protein GXN76_08480 [Kroppenstedtia pulmonis]|uniref:PhiEco32-like amidoligase-type 2 protein n=1 Tax=Kroppenstedtia pulmonis TaxID=1380685 RepID=A0A7D4BJV6_9BACL|nr:hypothetical protein [Kroppenstedtia pulmonis]QKG84510.1 hypothetical protein GXN76_08480 [Kroppenstedtia pulmonis]
MEPLYLQSQQLKSEQAVRNEVIRADHTLTPSIRLKWTKDPYYSESVLTLNPPFAVKNVRSKEYRNECLKLHGLTVPNKKATLLRQYVVVVFQTRVLILYRSDTRRVWLAETKPRTRESYKRVPRQETSREVRRVKETAIRGLYALGLDYGVIIVGILPGNVVAVLNVNPSPRLNREMESVFTSAILQYIHSLPRFVSEMDQVMMGADPEFLLQHTKGELVMASKYFPRFGQVGCDAIWHGSNRNRKPLVELRPRPSTNPHKLVMRMYQGMVYASKKIDDSKVKWLSGALPHPSYPLGGHIHFSGIPLNFKLLRALDNYLALSLVLVEDLKGVKRRPKYGFLGDFRNQFHGGFEYRTLPSWLISPTLTKGVLALAKVVAAYYPYLPDDPLAQLRFQKAYYQGNKNALKEKVQSLWENLVVLNSYKKYQIHLDALYSLLFTGTTWDESQDFRIYWKVPPYHR